MGDDLWFAMLGGGGGTYGIVTAMSIQLQEYKPLEYVAYDIGGCFSDPPTGLAYFLFAEVQSDFIVRFLLDPTKLEVEPPVTLEESNACGIVSTEQAFYCYGEKSGKRVAESWKQYWEGRKKEGLVAKLADIFMNMDQDNDSAELRDASTDLSLALIDTYAQCLSNEGGENQSLFTNFKDYYSMVTDGWTGDDQKRPIGPLFNNMYLSAARLSTNVLIPKDWIVKHKDKYRDLLFDNLNDDTFPTYFTLYYAFGDNTKNAQDNSVTALSDGYRNAGVMIYYQGTNVKFWKTVKDAYDFNFNSDSESDSSIFPSYVGSNHVMATTVGPKNDNYSLICPFDLTLEERKKECVSTQTIIYGGNKLKRLEQIKEDFDPDFLLDCAVCVRNDASP